MCGHCYCTDCMHKLGKHNLLRRTMSCPVCRENTAMGEISYVNTQLQPALDNTSKAIETARDGALPEQDGPTVLGRNSAKVEVVVQAIKNILADDSKAKVLVFSTVRVRGRRGLGESH